MDSRVIIKIFCSFIRLLLSRLFFKTRRSSFSVPFERGWSSFKIWGKYLVLLYIDMESTSILSKLSPVLQARYDICSMQSHVQYSKVNDVSIIIHLFKEETILTQLKVSYGFFQLEEGTLYQQSVWLCPLKRDKNVSRVQMYKRNFPVDASNIWPTFLGKLQDAFRLTNNTMTKR